MSHAVVYLQLEPGATLPDIAAFGPFRAVVAVATDVTSEWQARVSEWLVRSGCLYMMAWGTNCSSWDDSVDIANIEQFEFKDIPEDKFVMTTWHSDEPLREVFWFCKNNAFHPTIDLEHTLLVHISAQSKEREMLEEYREV